MALDAPTKPSTPGIFVRLDDVDLDLPLAKTLGSILFRPDKEGSIHDRIQTTRAGRYVSALTEISLDIDSGQRVGLIGANGAGKSTLLRVLAGIYAPTRGRREVKGKISTLLVSTAGMNANATGRENIFLSGRTLGMSRAMITEMEPDVIAFADLGEFIDLPLHTYSSGMRTRLGFAIATALDPEILLVDEVFGVGDASFRKKAEARMTALLGRAGILVLATHADSLIRQFCTRVCWLNQGRLAFYGEVDEGLARYAAAIKG